MEADAKSLISKNSCTDGIMKSNAGIKTRLVVLPILLLIVVFTTKIVYIALNFGADYGTKNGSMFNTFCEDLDEQANSKDSLDYQVCHHSMKLKNFLWINIDSLAIDQASIFSKELKDDLIFFKSKGTSYRQSGAMHESHLTGRVSTNFNGNPISNDNIIKQVRESKSQIPVGFSGEKFPIFTLVQSQFERFSVRDHSSSDFFKDMCDNDQESSFISFRDPSDEVRQKGKELNEREFMKYLEEIHPKYSQDEAHFEREMLKCLTNGHHIDSNHKLLSQSTVYYSAIVDHWNHSFSKKDTVTYYQIHFLNKFLVQLIQFYSKNFPDVAVIISSDHGGQTYNGEDSFCNHGCLSDSNEGIFAISHPSLKGQGYQGEMDYIDIAPTIAQILEGVNIPIQSQGKVTPIQKGEFKWEILALHLRYVQLKNFFEKTAEIHKFQEKNQINLDCLNLSQKYQDILVQDENQSLQQHERSEILQEFEQCIDKMNSEKDRIEFSMIDLSSVHLFELIIAAVIVSIILANYAKLKAAYQEYSSLNKIVFPLAILILFSDNLTVAVIKDNENSFFYTNQYVYLVLMTILFGVLWFKSTSCSTPLYKLEQELQTMSFNNFGMSNKLSGLFEKRLSLIHCFIFYCGHYFLCQYFAENDTILVVKSYQLKEQVKNQYLVYFNYLVFVGAYFFPKFQNLKIHWIQNFFYLTLFLKMIMYDLEDLRFLQHKTFAQTTDIIIISGSIGVFFVFNNLRAYSLFLDKKSSSDSQRYAAKIFFPSTLIDLSIFVFFIADDIERLFLIILYLPVIMITRKLLEILKLIHKTRTTSFEKEKSVKKFVRAALVMAILFQCIHRTFTAFKGTLTLDVNIKSGDKTIGAFQEDYPMYTAIVFGINKVTIPLLFFFDLSEMLLSIDPIAKTLKISQTSLGVIGIMLIKQLVSDYQLLVDMFSGSMFFGMFIWTTITGVFLVQLVPYSILSIADTIQFNINKLIRQFSKNSDEDLTESKQNSIEISIIS